MRRTKRAITILLAVIMIVGLVTPAMANTGHPFTDVGNTWYSEAVQYVWENNIMTGTSPTTFAPNAPLTRAQLVTILWRTEGEPSTSWRNQFTDVSAGQWYSNAVIWAFDNGIVTGTSPSTFAPGANITREQFATMMHRYAEFTGQDVTICGDFILGGFQDAGSVSSWAMTAMRWAVYTGLISGTGNYMLSPGGNATRAQAAVILTRFLDSVDTPEPPAPQSVNIVPLLGRIYSEVSHLFCANTDVIVQDGIVRHITVTFVRYDGTPGANRDAFNANGIDGTFTRAQVIAQLGAPQYGSLPWYAGYTSLDFVNYMAIHFNSTTEALDTDLVSGITIH